MEVRKTLKTGEHGTKRWQTQLGDRLLIVCYRYDDIKKLQYTTAKIIVDEKPCIHCNANGFIKKTKESSEPNNINEDVYIKIDYHALNERQKLKAAGAYWEPGKCLQKLKMAKVKELGLENRVIKYSQICILFLYLGMPYISLLCVIKKEK